MTAQLPSRERLTEIHKLAAKSDKYIYHLRADEVEAMTRALLAAHEQEPVATLDVQSGRTDGKKFALLYSLAAHQLPDDVYFLHIHPAPVPAVPDGYVLMPMKLTAENGAKYALSGEFHVLHRVTCHECGGEGCSDCDDEGSFEEKIMIGWDDIKDIYRAAVEACSIKSTGEGM